MDVQQELCATGLVLGLNYDQKLERKTDIVSKKLLKLERSSSDLFGSTTNTLELTLGLFDESPKVSVMGEQKICNSLGRVSSQQQSPTQSTVSSFSDDHPLILATKTENDTENDEHEKVDASQISTGDEEDGNAKKKLRLTKEQSILLEHKFKEHTTLNTKQKQALAKQLNLRPRQVEVWFQNRRARTKLKQTQVDCDFLKKCCDSLTEENRSLQKEIKELRALHRSSSTLYMQVPNTTFTVCPSCEKISSNNSNTPKVSAATVVMQPKSHFFNPFVHSATC